MRKRVVMGRQSRVHETKGVTAERVCIRRWTDEFRGFAHARGSTTTTWGILKIFFVQQYRTRAERGQLRCEEAVRRGFLPP